MFSSVTQSCLTLCDPMNHSTPGLPVHHQLPESTQTHVHWVGDAIQPSHVVPFSSNHLMSSPSPPALNLSQHQGLFKWVSSLHQVAKVLEFQLQHQSYQRRAWGAYKFMTKSHKDLVSNPSSATLATWSKAGYTISVLPVTLSCWIMSLQHLQAQPTLPGMSFQVGLEISRYWLIPLALGADHLSLKPGSNTDWSFDSAAAKSLQSCLSLCNPIDGSPPGYPFPGILQARTLEWIAISFSNAWKWKVKVKLLSCVRLLATPWTAAHQAPPSMGFPRQEYHSGVSLPSPLVTLGSHKSSSLGYSKLLLRLYLLMMLGEFSKIRDHMPDSGNPIPHRLTKSL